MVEKHFMWITRTQQLNPTGLIQKEFCGFKSWNTRAPLLYICPHFTYEKHGVPDQPQGCEELSLNACPQLTQQRHTQLLTFRPVSYSAQIFRRARLRASSLPQNWGDLPEAQSNLQGSCCEVWDFPSTEAVNLKEDPEKEKQTKNCLMLGGGLENEAVAVVFIVCTLIRESKNNDACNADFGTCPCSFSQARQPWEPLIEWQTRGTASITKPRAGQPFLWIKYVRDDKNLLSMGSGSNKKITLQGKTAKVLHLAVPATGCDIWKIGDFSFFSRHPIFLLCLFVSFLHSTCPPFLPRSPPPHSLHHTLKPRWKPCVVAAGTEQASAGTTEVCFSLRCCTFLPRKRGANQLETIHGILLESILYVSRIQTWS